MSRLGFAPIPAPGETVYSVFCRFFERSRFLQGDIISALTEQKYPAGIISVLPCYIGRISKNIVDGHPWKEPLNIVNDHTSLPYFTFFLKQKEREKWASQLIGYNRTATILGLTNFPISPGPVHPKFCLQCAVDQDKKHGFSYFRRDHQLPGVFICHEHKEHLVHGCNVCGPYPIKNRGLSMAGRCCCDTLQPLGSMRHIENIDDFVWLAQESAKMVNAGGTKHSDVIAVLREAAVRKGLVHGGAKISYKEIAKIIEGRYATEFLEILGIPVWANGNAAPWIRRILYTETSKTRPSLYFLLLVGALFGGLEDFEAFVHDSTKGNDTGTLENLVRCDRFPALKDMVENGCSLATICRKFEVRYHILIRELRKQRIRMQLTKKMKKKLGAKLNSIYDDLQSGVSKKEVRQRYKLSEDAFVLIELDRPELLMHMLK